MRNDCQGGARPVGSCLAVRTPSAAFLVRTRAIRTGPGHRLGRFEPQSSTGGSPHGGPRLTELQPLLGRVGGYQEPQLSPSIMMLTVAQLWLPRESVMV